MAYINIGQWTPPQVLEWLKGLDNAMYLYLNAFSNNCIDGEKLLHIQSSSLEQMGIHCIGHQEIILAAVEHLKNFHYNLDRENLQYLALQVATASRSLYKQLEQNRERKTLDTDALMDITRTLAKIKPLICWLDRPPFKGQQQYLEIRKKMLTLALEMAISAQRDRFALRPVEQIIQNAEILAKLSDYIIQVISDPMLLQPASLILVTLKKKESDLGFYVSPSFYGIHRVTDIKFNSPAHISGKIEEGDEVVQINYQTVVGWQHKEVLLMLHDSKPDVILTMKKRPQHVKIYGQIYMKPYRLPSKKRSMAVRWGEASSPILSRPLELLPSVRRNFKSTKVAKAEDSVDHPLPVISTIHEDSDSDLLTPTAKVPDHELHLMFQTSRPFLQRRNTVCGDQSESFKYLRNVKFWQERRDKSISMGFGLEKAANEFPALNGSMPDILTAGDEPKKPSGDGETKCDNNLNSNSNNKRPVMMSSKSVRFDEAVVDNGEQQKKNIELSAFDAIPFVVDNIGANTHEDTTHSTIFHHHSQDAGQLIEAKNEALIQQKSHLLSFTIPPHLEDKPPAIEPRKEQQIAPTPPPRPKKPIEMSPSSGLLINGCPVPPPKPLDSPSALKSPLPSLFTPPTISPRPPAPAPPIETPTETLELLTPVKQKSLTLKKKNSILAKRRKVAVKSLPHSDIQGHLYRRTKDKSGAVDWDKGYFVLTDTALYFFRTKNALKAKFLVFLTGFTVSLASEIYSKPFAFKVYHALKTLYFAAETQEALNQWLEYMRRATGGNNSNSSQIADVKEIFTESEISEEENDENENVNNHQSAGPPEVVKHEKYHLGLGSLKKFNNPFSSNKSHSEKKQNDLPIPSAQFRSYKKVQGYAGLSPGNHSFPPDSALNLGSSSTPLNTPGLPMETVLTADKSRPVISPITPGAVFFPSHKVVAPPPPPPAVRDVKEICRRTEDLQRSPSKKFQPHNYIHASNPNLVDFEFNAEKPTQFSYDTSSSLLSGGNVTVNGTNGGHSLQGCMTLKDLMLQQRADDAKEVYNNRVFLGEEKEEDREKKKKRKQRNESAADSQSHAKTNYGGSIGGGGDQKIDKIQSRTLPKTPDYAQSFKPDDVDILMIRSKEGQSLRNFGYEFISEEVPQEGGGGGDTSKATTLLEKNRLAAAKRTDKVSPTTSWSRRTGLNWINTATDKNPQAGHWETTQGNQTLGDAANKIRTGSFKKPKGSKLDALKPTSSNFFSFNKIVGGGYDSKKASSPGQSPSHLVGSGMTLPLLSTSAGKKLQPTPSSSIVDVSGQQRKLSSASTASYFSKLSFAGSNKSAGSGASVAPTTAVAKEKKIFGSPRLHRAFFGKGQNSTHPQSMMSTSNSPGNRSPIFDEVILGQGAPSWMDTRRSNVPDVVATQISSGGTAKESSVRGTPEYPGMECPPVFRPETYTLGSRGGGGGPEK